MAALSSVCLALLLPVASSTLSAPLPASASSTLSAPLPASASPLSRLDASCGLLAVEGTVLRDACGRTRLFRGVNVVQKGWPWLPELQAFNPFTSLAPADYPFMRSWGVNALRLGALWPGWEPAIGVHNATYLSALADVVAAAGAAAGIYTLLDAHQDALSGAFCGEGIPDQYALLWAQGSQPFPMPLQPTGFPPNGGSTEPTAAQCASIGWSDVYFSSAAGKAFDVLYNGAQGRAAFGAFWSNVSSTFTQHRPDADPWVLGYEILNEPWAGDTASNPALLIPGIADRVNLQPFYGALSEHVRRGEAGSSSHHPLFLESTTWDDFFPVGFSALPGAGGGRDTSGGAVLSYHYYSYVNLEGDEGQVAIRVKDASRLQAAAMLTEFDMAQNPENMTHLLAACDAHSQGYISWEYKQFLPITGSDTGAFTGNGSINTPAITAFARTFPEAVAGDIVAYAFDAATGAFSLTFTQRTAASAPTVIFASLGLLYPRGLNVSVSGPASYSVEDHPPPPASPPRAGSSFPDPQPLHWAHILLAPTPGAPATATVSVNITRA